MRVLADECLPRVIGERLRLAGHDVTYVTFILRGQPDDRVLAESVQYDAVLVSSDTDFGELVFRDGHGHTGIVLNRLGRLSADLQAELIGEVFAEHGDALIGEFVTVKPRFVRFRRPRP